MKENNTDCFMTGYRAYSASNEDLYVTYVRCEEWRGSYAYDNNIHSKLRINKNDNSINQFRINCARKTLEINRSNLNVWPVWVTRAEIEFFRDTHLKEIKKNDGKVYKIFFAVEDCVEEQVDHSRKPLDLLESFAYRLRLSSAYATFKITPEDQVWARIVNTDELAEMIAYLAENKFIKIHPVRQVYLAEIIKPEVFKTDVQMTVKGWEQIRKIEKKNKSNKVFVASQFIWPDNSELRTEALISIKKACKDLGYEADIVSQDHTGYITDRIISEIRDSSFVIAELTYNNRGVYYEAGLAKGYGLNVFHIVKEDFVEGSEDENKRLHFDIQQIIYRKWKTPEDLYSVLKDWINNVVGRY